MSASNTDDDKAFRAMQEAVEHLYELGLLRGDRLKDGAGRIYFGDLKLTTKGEQETIRHRKQQVGLARELAEASEASRKVIEGDSASQPEELRG